jgi:hypothetical protein
MDGWMDGGEMDGKESPKDICCRKKMRDPMSRVMDGRDTTRVQKLLSGYVCTMDTNNGLPEGREDPTNEMKEG